ncbi:hypothetical protein ACQR1Y_34510 [Bradyrhizobium sp. HKCCYLRH3099]|uniref:hypothetical protein n=1 Tax=Bradyrhizobium sp. HKCCYLRH3099 TaxID=3420762 RepID=UPI003EB918DE
MTLSISSTAAAAQRLRRTVCLHRLVVIVFRSLPTRQEVAVEIISMSPSRLNSSVAATRKSICRGRSTDQQDAATAVFTHWHGGLALQRLIAAEQTTLPSYARHEF